MKKLFALIAVMGYLTSSLSAQTETPMSSEGSQHNIMLGAGAVNGLYIIVKNADKIQSGDTTSFFAGITTNSVKPLYFIKYESKLGKRHTLGLNFANSGIVIGGIVRDSFFLTDQGVLTQANLDVTYRSRSLNLRYNYLFNTSEAFQVYWGLGIGIRGNSISVKTNSPNMKNSGLLPDLPLVSMPTMGFESTLGFRGKIQEHLGWYAEMGISKAVFQAGLSYRF